MKIAVNSATVRAMLVAGAFVALAFACSVGKVSEPVPQTLSVGLPRAEAEQRLDRAGAELAISDSLGPAPADALEDGAFYSLRNGALLEIGYRRGSADEEYTVDRLSVCRDPDVGKVDRVFEDVQELEI